MNPAIARAVAGFAKTLQQVGGNQVTYARGDYQVTLTATKARVLRSLDIDNARLEAEEQDWILTAAELALNDETVLPARGDTIEHCGQTYAVLGGNDTPSWRPHDQYGLMLRVHTKRVS